MLVQIKIPLVEGSAAHPRSMSRPFIKASAHRTRPSAAACGQKSVLLYIASSVANRKRPDAAAGGRPLVSLQFCI